MAGIVLFLSVLLPVVQYQRYLTAIQYLTNATMNNLSLRSGGTKQTTELFQRASEAYEVHMRNGNIVQVQNTNCFQSILFLIDCVDIDRYGIKV